MEQALKSEDEMNELATPLSRNAVVRPLSPCSTKNARMQRFFDDFPRMKEHPVVKEFVEDLDDLDIHDIDLLSILVVRTPFSDEMKTVPALRDSREARRQRRHQHLQDIKRRINEIAIEATPQPSPSFLSSLVKAIFFRGKDELKLK